MSKSKCESRSAERHKRGGAAVPVTTQLKADAGYCCDANLTAMEEREIDAYIAPGRAKHAGEGEGGGARVAAMRERIRPAGTPAPTA